MNINEVSGTSGAAPPSVPKKIKEEKPAGKSKTDRAELSHEARSLFATDQSNRMAEIQGKIASGFYNQREVVRRVVDALLKDIT